MHSRPKSSCRLPLALKRLLSFVICLNVLCIVAVSGYWNPPERHALEQRIAANDLGIYDSTSTTYSLDEADSLDESTPVEIGGTRHIVDVVSYGDGRSAITVTREYYHGSHVFRAVVAYYTVLEGRVLTSDDIRTYFDAHPEISTHINDGLAGADLLKVVEGKGRGIALQRNDVGLYETTGTIKAKQLQGLFKVARVDDEGHLYGVNTSGLQHTTFVNHRTARIIVAYTPGHKTIELGVWQSLTKGEVFLLISFSLVAFVVATMAVVLSSRWTAKANSA